MDSSKMSEEEEFLTDCLLNNFFSVKEHIKNGIDINVVDIEGKNGLMLACEASINDDHFDLVKLLLRENIDLNRIDNNNCNALSYATNPRKNIKIIMLLIQNETLKLSPDLLNKFLSNFFWGKVSDIDEKRVDVLKTFIDNRKRIGWEMNGDVMNLLCYCSKGDSNLSLARFLIQQKEFDIDTLNSYGYSPLILALSNQNIEICKLLIGDKRVDLNRRYEIDMIRDSTFLMFSCMTDRNFDLVCLLVNEDRCDLNLQNSCKETAIMYAYIHNEVKNKKILKLLIETKRCDLNIKNENGLTLFMMACKKGDEEIAKLLIKSGRCNIEEFEGHPNCQYLIDNYFIKKRNNVGSMLMLIKNKLESDYGKKRSLSVLEGGEENPLRIIPKELIHLILSYAYPLASQTKYSKNE